MSNPTEPPEPGERVYESIARPNPATLIRTATHGSRLRRSSTAGTGILSRTGTHLSHKETYRDPSLDPELPYRTFSEAANLEEYTTEHKSGEIDGGIEPDGKSRYKLVTFVIDDPENPKNW